VSDIGHDHTWFPTVGDTGRCPGEAKVILRELATR